MFSIASVAQTLGVFLLGGIIHPVLSSAIIMTLTTNNPTLMASYPWLGTLIPHSCMIIFSLIFLAIMHKGNLTAAGFQKPQSSFFLATTLISVVTMSAISVISLLLGIKGMDSFIEQLSYLQVALFIIILAPIAEEIFCRGFIYEACKKITKQGVMCGTLFLSWPVVLSTLFFVLIHLPVAFMVDTISLVIILCTSCATGLIAGYYREKTQSLIPAIYTHMLFNLIGMIIFFGSKKL